jgi:hypothetical protein
VYLPHHSRLDPDYPVLSKAQPGCSFFIHTESRFHIEEEYCYAAEGVIACYERKPTSFEAARGTVHSGWQGPAVSIPAW